MIEDKIQWIKERPYLCINPYVNYDLRVQQEKLKITVCCNLDTSMTNKAVDVEFIDNLKIDIENKKVPAACHLCTSLEKHGALSERVKNLLDFPGSLEQFEQDKKVPEFQVGMKLSNRCNLACRSCNSFNSSYWSDKMKVPSEPGVTEDFSDDPVNWKMITDTIRQKHSETGHFIFQPIGGETMMQNGFSNLLDWMIADGLAATTSIRITTNLAVNLEDFRDRFLQFNQVEFIASIDSIGDNYHYVRWPSKFNKVLNNLAEIIDVRTTHPGKYHLMITPVFSLNNIFYVIDWIDFWKKWCNDNNVAIHLQTTHINKPAALMVEALPDQYRPPLIELLKQAVSHPLFQQYPSTVIQLEYFKSMLLSLQLPGTHTDKLFGDYLKYSADYDRRTSTDSFKLNSRLYDLLSQEHRAIYMKHHSLVNVDRPVYNIEYNLEELHKHHVQS